jgi:endonuclease/exonuclease/phosphatase (EEP) superfamily protein YafD
VNWTRILTRTLTVALWLLAVPCAVWAVVRLFGLERGYPAVQLIAFTPYVAAAAVVVAAAALLTRRWAAGAVAAVAAVSLCAVVLPRAIPDGGSAANGPVVRVLSANLQIGFADERAVLDLARRLKVDVLAVQELTPADASSLESAGVDDVFPHRAAYPADGVVGSALFSRHPLRDAALRVHRSTFTQARATVEVPGAAPVQMESVHPQAPWGRPVMAGWERDLRDQPPATVDGPLRVLLGDFNATLDHAAMRRLIGTGYRDAASVAGNGFHATWPYDEKWYVPGIALDRVLADRRIGVRTVRAYEIPGSDHKAVYAELILPKA